ncbi:hypothetical protein SAMN05443432_101246 [Roseovarius litoreus]|uniref:Uncharacterized protein n=1 Tax=Roseovarius litoreus TaxID=1155722 RepID=A0A1M7A067_9RHOB|nr:hypothetical protein SAMN05443432_101246 [Roseovarius litoreus]
MFDGERLIRPSPIRSRYYSDPFEQLLEDNTKTVKALQKHTKVGGVLIHCARFVLSNKDPAINENAVVEFGKYCTAEAGPEIIKEPRCAGSTPIQEVDRDG